MSVRAAARAARIPVRSLQSVIDGKKPSIERAATICRRLNFRFVLGPDDEGQKPELPASSEAHVWGGRRGQIVTPYDVPVRKNHAPQHVGIAPNGCAHFGLEFLLSFDLNPELCEIVEFRDNSMAPEFPAGAAGLVDLRRTERIHGCVYAIDASGLIVRRAHRDGDVWTAVCDNPRYKAIAWDSGFRCIGKVVWTSHMVDTEPAAQQYGVGKERRSTP